MLASMSTVASPPTRASDEASPPTSPRLLLSRNILYVVLEDFSTLASPVFSTDQTHRRRTPHLERLAARGTVFQRAYCQAPICNPSRTSFMTSRRPGTTRVFTNDDLVFPALPTLVDFLKAADSTAAVACAGRGKIFHIACDVEPHGFENGALKLRAGELGAAAERHLHAALNASFPTLSAQSYVPTWQRRNGALASTLHSASLASCTKDVEKAAVGAKLLAHYARTATRFFLAVGLASTHVHGGSICMPDAISAEGGHAVGPQAPLATKRSLEHDPPLLTWPNWDLTVWDKGARRNVPRFDITDRWQRETIGSYYACASHVDAQIGALLGALDVLQLTASTSVVVQGDHGFSLGRHGRWSKYNLYEDSTRVPLIIAVPGTRAATVWSVVESLDLMPTLLELWGVPRRPTAAEAEAEAAAAATTTTTTTTAAVAAAAAIASAGGAPFRYGMGAGGTSVPLDGESLLPFVRDGASSGDKVRMRRYAASEMREWMVLHRPWDTQLPGAMPRFKVGRGQQYYLRTTRYAYAVYVRRQWGRAQWPATGGWQWGYWLMDEMLYDHDSDPEELINIAYKPQEARVRERLLQMVMREWNLTFMGTPEQLRAPNRTKRAELLAADARMQRRDELARIRRAAVAKERCGTRPTGTNGGPKRRAWRICSKGTKSS